MMGEHGDSSNIRDSLETRLTNLENWLQEEVYEKQRKLSERNRLRNKMIEEQYEEQYERKQYEYESQRQKSPSIGRILGCVLTLGIAC